MKSAVIQMPAPPVIATPLRVRRWLAFGGMAVAALLATVLFLFNPTTHGFYPRCELYVTTGWFCPGCGSLRAMYLLSHGRVLAALHSNALLVLGLPVVVFFGWQFVSDAVAGRAVRERNWSMRTIYILLAVGVGFTILRNIPMAPFNWLAPIS